VGLKEYIKSLIRKQIEEMSVTGGGEVYSTPFAFAKKGQKTNAAIQTAKSQGMKLVPAGIPKNSKVLDYKELWKGKKSAMNENNNPTLEDILNKKDSLDHLKGMYLKIIEGPFTQKQSKYINKGCKFLFHDKRANMVGVELEDGKSANLYPKELIIDTERFNMRETLKKLIEQELLNEVTYSKFKKDVKHRTKSEQLHKAIREVKRKLMEIDRIVEYTSRMKQELSEDEGGISYWKATQNNIGRISEMVNQLNNKIKNLHQ
jgi:hypothetical protein